MGANQIDLMWWAPDNEGNRYLQTHFATKEGETFNIREFSWARSEVSAAANFHKPVVWYNEVAFPFDFAPSLSPSKENLVPGKTYKSNAGLVKGFDNDNDCQATLDYTVSYQLRSYFDAPAVRDHRME